jgi:NAD kinase
MTFEKIILVTRKTRLEGLVERFNTRSQARFYINQSALHRGASSGDAFVLYRQEHDVYHAAVDKLHSDLQTLLKVQVIERAFLPNFIFTDKDVVVTIGIDGLVVNTAKYLQGQPVVAVNPDPQHIDGILLPFTVQDASQAVQQVLEGHQTIVPVSMAEARLNDGQSMLAFNDLFIGARTHVSARYRVSWDKKDEVHSSSGIIVSTGAGSTGWLSSMINMTNGIVKGFGGKTAIPQPSLKWNADQLIFVVREPFISKTSGAEITCGSITQRTPLVIESQMPEGGVIFSDGVEADYLAFNSGSVATINLAERKTNLVKPFSEVKRKG